MILVIVSILGVGAAQIALMGERGARNDRDYQLAWQAADAALMDAEFDISGSDGATAARSALFAPGNRMGFVAGCGAADSGTSRGLCLPATSGTPVWLTADFTGSNSPAVEFGTFSNRGFDAGESSNTAIASVKPSRKPRYLTEVLDDPEVYGNQGINRAAKPLIYRVTAMGFGPRPDIQSVMQMLYRKD
jgi:type IV pilus assembly protein PilX